MSAVQCQMLPSIITPNMSAVQCQMLPSIITDTTGYDHYVTKD